MTGLSAIGFVNWKSWIALLPHLPHRNCHRRNWLPPVQEIHLICILKRPRLSPLSVMDETQIRRFLPSRLEFHDGATRPKSKT